VKPLTVTVEIPTKDRYFTTLPLVLMGLIKQTKLPDKVIIFDDGDQQDLRGIPLYQFLFRLLDLKNIKWEVVFGHKIGQVALHQQAIEMATTDLIWRLDDDTIPQPDVLEVLIKHFEDSKVAAVGGSVVDPKLATVRPAFVANKIEDLPALDTNAQWFLDSGGSYEVDHLFSTFVYRKAAAKHGYNLNLSPAGFREETLFTYEMKHNGWKLKVDPTVVTWHFRNPEGGLREFRRPEAWIQDNNIYLEKIQEWGIIPNKFKYVVLDNGLGDHLAFKNILPEIKKRFKDHKILMFVCYPEVFEDEHIQVYSIADALAVGLNLENYNLYKKMWDWDWKTSLVDAYRRLYL